MSLSTFLEQCEKLTYSERKEEAVKCGLRSRTDPEQKKSIANLFDGPLYHQFLALETCHGSQDVGLALRALAVPSRLLRERAITVILLYGTDSDALSAISSLPIRDQFHAIWRLRTRRRRRQRPRVIDQILEDLRNDPDGSRTFRRLLPLASPDLVNRYLQDVMEELQTTDWWRLATFHPAITQKALEDWAIQSKEKDPRILRIANQTIWQWALSEETSNMALGLVESLNKSTPLSQIRLKQIVRRRPIQIVEMILASEDKVKIALDLEKKTIRKLPVELLQSLLGRYKRAVLENEFPDLKPEQKRGIYPLIRDSWTSKDGEVPTKVLATMPADLRVSEARKQVKLRLHEEKPSGRIPYISLLPWDEAMEKQTPFLRSREADIRMSALESQIEAVKYGMSYSQNSRVSYEYRSKELPKCYDPLTIYVTSQYPHLSDIKDILVIELPIGLRFFRHFSEV